jgi:C4-dicarboxylate transporter DctQ subunit
MGKILALLEEYIPAVLMLVTSLLVFVQVVIRYIFSSSLIWVEEFARYGIVWFVFLGASLAVRNGAHASVDVLVGLLPGKPKKAVQIIATIISIVFCVLITYYGLDLVMRVRQMGNTTPAMKIPMYIPYLAIPVGCLLMAFRYVLQLFREIKTPSVKG